MLELNGIEQIRALCNLTKIFREGSMILDQFLELAFHLDIKKFDIGKFNAHYTIAIRNANSKATLIIYSIETELLRNSKNIQLGDPELQYPVTLQPL